MSIVKQFSVYGLPDQTNLVLHIDFIFYSNLKKKSAGSYLLIFFIIYVLYFNSFFKYKHSLDLFLDLLINVFLCI